MLNITIRKKAKQFGRLVRQSALTRRTGVHRLPELAAPGELALTFIGHSSFFVQMGGKNLVVDPNFARWLVVLKRQRRPGLRLRDLPPIDCVLVTHAHMDHLHRPSLRAIARATRRRTGRAPAIVVPRAVRDLVLTLGYDRVVELDWWQTHEQDGIAITHVPARHWGARMIHDTHRGYGGYVLRCGAQSVYHAGDTAYDGRIFREIGARLRPELALMPIGAYHPPSFRAVHASPEEALQGFLDLGARWMVPMHYGTFRLSHEPMDEPVERLLAAARDAGVSDRVQVLEEGVTTFFSERPETSDEDRSSGPGAGDVPLPTPAPEQRQPLQ